ncbi:MULTISPECIES: TetR/AcrR family transcriptional regulator [unclassified Agarivorans]|uniref:TetR/AcrR family transcriptional regulator n=1 Tax=unclassified Agarivorans TaxID=2636026 RepID=UPI003D7F03FC
MASSKRDQLIDTAQRLFYQHGFRATGIDAVLAESGVAKKTLYNHFKSKEELIIATLTRRDQQFMDLLQAEVKRLTSKQDFAPQLAPIMAFFDGLNHWINSDSFFGCMFINASAEYPRHNDPVHITCATHKEQVINFIEDLLSDLQLNHSAAIARQLSILVDGAIVGAHTTGDYHSPLDAKAIAQVILTAHLQLA